MVIFGMSEEIKLNALRENLRFYLYTFHAGSARYYDPLKVKDLFVRANAIFDKLRSEKPEFFSDFPTRDEKSSGTTDFEGRGYFYRHQLETLLSDIEYCMNIISGMSSVEIPSMKVTREGIFFAGQYFDAIQRVGEILSSARQDVVIIDAYFDHKILDLLTAKNPSVEIEILTKNVTPALKAAALAFNKQYGKLNIRKSTAFHDRFIIIDSNDFYHFRASLDKHLGNRGFMFSRIEEPVIISSLAKEFAQEWNNSPVEIQYP